MLRPFRVMTELERLQNLCKILCAHHRIDGYGIDLTTYELTYLDRLPDEWDEQLWNQGVQTDDVDYAILCSRDYVYRSEDREEQGHLYGPPLLNGCCENKWFEVVLDGKEYALGVAYHG